MPDIIWNNAKWHKIDIWIRNKISDFLIKDVKKYLVFYIQILMQDL